MTLLLALAALFVSLWALILVGSVAHKVSTHLDGLDKERVYGPPHGPRPVERPVLAEDDWMAES